MMGGTMDTIKVFLDGVGIFFIIYLIGYSTFLFLSVVVGSSTLYRKRQQERMKNILLQDYYVPVTIVVPAYNEEITVVETVKSLLSLDYKLYEIIVVDDGSKDDTSKVLIDAFDMQPIHRPVRYQIQCQPAEFVYETLSQKVPLTLIRKKNGGKADALNMGINASNYPYFICMDADSVLQHDSLSKIVQPVLEQGHVVAVGGTVRPSNNVEIAGGRVVKYRLPRNLLACMQVLEYDRSFLASRILFDKFNGSLIISGAFGLFKKEIVIAAGGYDHTTMGEDMELVVKLHDYCVSNDIPYLIRYATDAICWTQAPERLRDLCKQRKRWHLGLFQSMWRHRSMFANPKFGAVSLISYLYFLLYELLSPFIELFGILTMLLAFWVDLINVPFMILFFLIYAIFGSVLSLTAFFARIHTIDLSISFSDVTKAVILCFFEITCLRFVMAFVRTTAFIGYKKKKLQWGRIERKKIDLTMFLLVFLCSLWSVQADAQVTTTKEATGSAESIYVAGNPELYPMEYYNEKTECYEGIVPELFEKVSEATGKDFVYVSGGEKNLQKSLAKNCQVEIVSAHVIEEREVLDDEDQIILMKVKLKDRTEKIGISFTEIASKELKQQVIQAFDKLSSEEKAEIAVSYVMEHEPGKNDTLVICLVAVLAVLSLFAVGLFTGVLRMKRRQIDVQREMERIEEEKKAEKEQKEEMQEEDPSSEQLLQLELQKAVKNREFELYLQFIVGGETKKILGAEALSRWQSPKEGMLRPGKYIGNMHRMGVIESLDLYILEESCKQLEEWKNQGFTQLFLTTNLTRSSLSKENFMDQFREITEKYQFDHERLWLEITEDSLSSDGKCISENVAECKRMGFSIVLDDFGSGYSSLRDLCDFPVDCIKVDRDLILKSESPRGREVLNRVIDLAHSMEIKVLCEGVETEEEHKRISETSCEYIQGFYFSRVIPKEYAMDYYRQYSKNRV